MGASPKILLSSTSNTHSLGKAKNDHNSYP
jgi:hypothetical protein